MLKSSTFSKAGRVVFQLWLLLIRVRASDAQRPPNTPTPEVPESAFDQEQILPLVCVRAAGTKCDWNGTVETCRGWVIWKHSDTHSPICDLISCSAQVCRFHVCNLSAAWPVMSHELFIAFDWRSIPAYHRCFFGCLWCPPRHGSTGPRRIARPHLQLRLQNWWNMGGSLFWT